MAVPLRDDDLPLEADVPRPREIRALSSGDGSPVVGNLKGSTYNGAPIRMSDTKGVDDLTMAALSGALIAPVVVARKYDRKTLKPKHIAVVRLAAQGYRPAEISRYLALKGIPMGANAIRAVLSSPPAKAVMGRMLAIASENLDTQQLLKNAAPEAAMTVLEAMREAVKPSERAKIGFAILDRTGHGPSMKHEVTPTSPLGGDHPALERIARVMEEARDMARIPYTPARVRTSPPSGSEIEVSPTSSLPARSGSVGLPSPDGSPSSSQDRTL